MTCRSQVLMVTWLGLTLSIGVLSQQGVVIHAALNEYAVGRYQESITYLRSLGDAVVLRNRLRTDAASWIEAAIGSERDRRSHIAAVVALEAAHLSLADPRFLRPVKHNSDLRTTSPFLALDLIEDGCSRLRTGPLTEFERLWVVASMALLQSQQNGLENIAPVHALRPDPSREASTRPDPLIVAMESWGVAHRNHVSARFRDEPRLALAKVLALPEVRHLPNRPGTPAFFMTTGIGDDTQSREQQAVERVREAIEQLTALTETPGIGAEARLRRAMLLFHRARGSDLANSLRDAREAAGDAGDPHVAFMGHLYAGMVLDGMNRRSEAIEEYRLAAGVIPHARSSAFALATDLFLSGQRDEAAFIVEETMAAQDSDDPWRTFSLGDYRFWPSYLSQLRDHVRR